MKKLYLVLCMALCMVAFTACGNSKKETTSENTFNEATVKSGFEDLMKSVGEGSLDALLDDASYKQYVASVSQQLEQQLGDGTGAQTAKNIAESMKSIVEAKKEAGAYKSVEDTKVTYGDNFETATAEAKVVYEKKSLIVKLTFDKQNFPVACSAEDYKTFGEKMINAGLNTLMGMGTVFVVLIFISLVISLLGLIPKFMNKKNAKVVPQVETKIVEQAPVVEEEEELVDDSELVAVITAAIMASMGDEAPADGLVVRSIRKVNSKWKNA